MKKDRIGDLNLPNIEDYLKEIFDCQNKIKSLTSTLFAMRAETAMLEHFLNVIEQSSVKGS